MKYVIGIVIGIVITLFYPDIVPYIKNAFIESGIRDSAIQTLQSVRQVRMYMMGVVVKATALSVLLVVIAMVLGACGNTVKGIGTDIMKMGDTMMKEESKDVVSK